MRRFKFPILLSLFILLLSGLVLSLSKPVSKINPEREVAVISPGKRTLRSNFLKLYSLREQEIATAVESYFERAIASGEIVGAGVSVVLGDSIVVSEGFGIRNEKTGKKVDDYTIFRLGSLSKGFTGILAAKMVSEGKLHWGDQVTEYFPDFRLGDLKNTEQITLENLLSHTSGAPYHSFTNLVEAGLSLEEIAERFKEVKPISEPGSMYSYQNALFALSGEIMKKATGTDLDESLKNRFFDPLGMCSTTMDYDSHEALDNVALPHVRWRQGWKSRKLNDHYYNAIAAGGINASAQDMGKWMRLLLGHKPELMSKAELEAAFKPVVQIPGRSKYYQRWPGHISSYYGYGWRIHKFREGPGDQVKTILHHGGSVNNFRNEIALYPETDLGICVLLNSNSRLARNVVPDLYQIVTGILERTDVEMASNYIPE